MKPSVYPNKNIILHGLYPKYPLSSNTEIKNAVQSFFQKLKLDINPRRVHLLGTQPAPNVPVLICLKSWEDKRIIFRNAYKLRTYGTKYTIKDDLSMEDRRQRGELSPLYNQAKAAGHEVYYRRNQLYINGKRVYANLDQATEVAATSAVSDADREPQALPTRSLQ
jgi:hypothetical protein